MEKGRAFLINFNEIIQSFVSRWRIIKKFDPHNEDSLKQSSDDLFL